MKKLSPNAPCPCGGGLKYKKCCRPFHRGARAPDALILMKSRYSAYVAGESDYLIHTTHPDNPDYRNDFKSWRRELLDFCRSTRLTGLEILEFHPGDHEASVHFIAHMEGGLLEERSHFLLEEEWRYHHGEFPQA